MNRRLCLVMVLTVIFTFLFSGVNAIAVEDDLLHVYFVDVGQADVAIITCEDKVMMIDGD